MPNYKTLIIDPSPAYGDLIETTRILNSFNKTKSLLNLEIKVKIAEGKRQILEGYLKNNIKDNKGFVSELLDPNYKPSDSELEIDLEWYQNELPNIYPKHYTEAMLCVAERQLSNNLKQDISLERNVESELRFPSYRFQKEIEQGKSIVQKIKTEYKKPIIWIGATTAGSNNRSPQFRKGKENFWEEIINSFNDRFIFYELRGPNDKPISECVLPKENLNLSFAAESEIIKETVAGIGIDSMQIHWAYALGKKKMVVVLGSTHPKAVIYPNAEKTMLTVPSLTTIENLEGVCHACGIHKYNKNYDAVKKGMKTRYPEFEFHEKLEEAIIEDNPKKLDDAVKKYGCRKLKLDEDLYDCWELVTINKVVNGLECLVR